MSLRERKKAETRQRIADRATVLFATRGFDNVTIAEIAEASDVSKVTVFNYFPRKEDMFFDRFPQVTELITTAVEKADGSPVTAMRALITDLAEQRHPIGGLEDRYAHFWRTVLGSAALRARAREAVDEFTAQLAALIAETTDDQDPALTAAVIFATCRTVFVAHAVRVLDGEPAAEVTRDYVTALGAAFDRLAAGWA
jgi:AcrR family transcriptional regulator